MHTSCAGINSKQYDDVHYSFIDWRCTKCIFQYLPFASSSFNEPNKNVIDKFISKIYEDDSVKQDNIIKTKYDQFNNNGFKCTHLNICSLYRNIDEINHFLHDNDIQILALNETLLDDSISDKEVKIENYDLVRKDRNRNGGGVAICIYGIRFATS